MKHVKQPPKIAWISGGFGSFHSLACYTNRMNREWKKRSHTHPNHHTRNFLLSFFLLFYYYRQSFRHKVFMVYARWWRRQQFTLLLLAFSIYFNISQHIHRKFSMVNESAKQFTTLKWRETGNNTQFYFILYISYTNERENEHHTRTKHCILRYLL